MKKTIITVRHIGGAGLISSRMEVENVEALKKRPMFSCRGARRNGLSITRRTEWVYLQIERQMLHGVC
ncbi:MAG: hypothetical protein K6F50_08690 [Kiritimatiellae bacterium]|nr:hypothetical protein [Kiritimatiellia bacterium]